eukprot:6491753-Lingulodinium_polyedra.AAC.1
MMSARLRQRSCPSAPMFMPLAHGHRRSHPSAPMPMPLDMDANAIRCKNERRQRGNGPLERNATQRRK